MDPADRKHALRLLTHGLHVVSASDGEHIAAGAITWLSQASFSPPLVTIAVRVKSGLHHVIENSGAFAVNIVGEEQRALASAFFRSTVVEGDRINGYVFESGPATGSPLLLDTPAWFEARVTDAVKRGDHTVFVGEVVEAGVRDASARPLALSDTPWQYGG